jgi:hypothetical protein
MADKPEPFQSRLIVPKFGRDEAIKTLRMRSTEQYTIGAIADTMSPMDLDLLDQWLRWNPNLDPLVAVPMMLSGITPESEAGVSVTKGSIAAAIEDGTYANDVAYTGDGLGNATRQDEAPVRKPDDYMTEPEESWLDTLRDNIMPDPGTILGDSISSGLEPITASSRMAITTLMTGYDFLQAGSRSAAGDMAKAGALADKWGLTEEEKQIAFNIDAISPDDKAIDEAWGQDILGQTTPADLAPEVQKKIRGFLRDYRTPGTFRVGGEATGDTRAKMLAGESVGAQAYGQTILGNTTVSEIAADKGSWLPPTAAIQKSEQRAIEAYDIRTAQEVARGVEPLGWTPGRGLAHVWWDADETAFNTVSGVVDASINLTTDPINLIPLGAVGKVVTVPARLARPGGKAALDYALKSGGETIAVRTDIRGTVGVPAGRKGTQSVQGVNDALAADRQVLGYGETQVKTVVDPVFQGRNVDIMDDGRVISKTTGKNAPSTQFLARERAWTWLNSGKGARVVDDLASRTSAYDIWKRSGGDRGGMTWELAETLSRSNTAHDVRAVLASRMGMEIDRAGQLVGFGQSPMVLKFGDSWLAKGSLGRWATRATASAARGKVVAFHDSDTIVRELDAFGTAAKVDHDTMKAAVDSVLSARGSADRYDALYGKDGFFTKTIRESLIREGVDEEIASRLSKAYDGALDQSQRDLWNKGIAFGGGPSTGYPTLLGEGLGDAVAMPSYREILRGASVMRGVRQKVPGKVLGDSMGDAANSITSAWRNAILVRPAYTLREVGEMSFALALSGYDSWFTHPLQMIAMATHVAANHAAATAAANLMKAMATGTGDAGVRMALRREANNAATRRREGEILAGLAGQARAGAKRGVYEGAVATGKVGKVARDTLDFVTLSRGHAAIAPYLDANQARITGEPMWKEFERYQETGDTRHLSAIADAMSYTHGNFVQDEVLRHFGKHMDQVRRPDIAPDDGYRYAQGIADRLRAGSADPDIRNLASGRPYTETLDEYQKFRKAEKETMLANARGGEMWAGKTDDDYLQAQTEILTRLTGSDAELMEAVATGKFNNLPIGADNRAFVAKVKEVAEKNPADFPEFVGVVSTKGFGARGVNALNDVATDFFQNTAAFSDIFARGPLVRQAYADRIIELAPYLSPAAKADAVAKLRGAGDVYLAKRVQQAPSAKGGLTIDEAEAIATGYALREAQRVFYDASRRQNWALAARVVSPFAQATVNTFKRWGLMSIQNPQMYYRSMKPLFALQQPGSAVLYDVMAGITGDSGIEKFYEPGRPSMSANGFFYTDSRGERKFAYPMIGPLARMMGAPEGTVMESSMENLNVAGTTMNPGFGPLVTLSASFAFSDEIAEDTFAGDVLRASFPYGLSNGDDNPVAKALNAFLPTAYRKLIEASYDSPARMNTSISVMSGLIDTGQYDMSNNADVTRLQNDAEEITQRLMWWSAVGGAFTPSTFSPDMLVEVKDPQEQAGVTQWMMIDKIQAEYQKYTEDDYKTGSLNFVRDYGGTALFSALPRTKTTGIAQATNDMWKFRTDNPDSYKENIEVIGLFMSNDDLGSAFARDLFMEQRREGVRSYMTRDEYIEKANDAIGWILWNKTTADIDAAVGDDDDEVANLRALARRDLVDRFPGFSPSARDTGKTTELIAKVEDALKDPAVQSLPSAFYIDRYLRQRNAAVTALIEQGGTDNLKAKGNSDIAQALTDLGNQYANDDTSGGFRHIWNRLFSQELYAPPIEED